MRLRKIGLIAGGVLGVLVAVPVVLVVGVIVASVFTKQTLENAEARARIEEAFGTTLPAEATDLRMTENPLPDWQGEASFSAPAEVVTAWLEIAFLCFPGALAEGIDALRDPSPAWQELASSGSVRSGQCPEGFGGDPISYRMLIEERASGPWHVHLAGREG